MEPFILSGDWKVCAARSKQFLIVNEAPEEKKVLLFLTVIGGQTCALLRDLCAPQGPDEKSYADLVAILANHFKTSVNIITQIYHFGNCKRMAGQSFNEYVRLLKKRSKDLISWTFRGTTRLNSNRV